MERHKLYNDVKDKLIRVIAKEFNLEGSEINENELENCFIYYDLNLYTDKKDVYNAFEVDSNDNYHELRCKINELLDEELHSGFNTLKDLLVNKIKENPDSYDIERMIMPSNDFIVVMHHGVLDRLIDKNILSKLNLEEIYDDIDKIFEDYPIDEVSIKVELIRGNIRFYKTKKEFIDEFDFSKADMLDYILSYDTQHDDFIKDVQDVALTYLQDAGIINDRYALNKVHNQDRDYKYIYINGKVVK